MWFLLTCCCTFYLKAPTTYFTTETLGTRSGFTKRLISYIVCNNSNRMVFTAFIGTARLFFTVKVQTHSFELLRYTLIAFNWWIFIAVMAMNSWSGSFRTMNGISVSTMKWCGTRPTWLFFGAGRNPIVGAHRIFTEVHLNSIYL